MPNLRSSPCISATLALLALALVGCPSTPGRLAKHANAFSGATIRVVNGASDAYRKANELHDQAEISLAVLDYDKKPAWNPNDYVKPLLSQEQLTARIEILNGLKSYAKKIADLAAGGKQTDLESAATEVGSSLQNLSKNVPSALSTSIPDAGPMSDTTKNAVSTALLAFGKFLQEAKITKSLPQVIGDNDKNVSELCDFLDSDIRILRRQADVDYGRVITSQDQYIRHEGSTLSAEERRSEIRKLPQFVLEQRQNDQLLAKLQKTIQTLSETHHAFAVAAQSGNPESLSQYINDLSAQGQSLAAFYDELSKKASTTSAE